MEYLKRLYEMLEENSNDDNAFLMSAYMKDNFKFYGIKSLQRREIARKFYIEKGRPSEEEVSQVVRELWDAEYRECQYIAQELLARKKYLEQEDMIDTIQYMIDNKAWWDTIDNISTNLAGEYLRIFPEKVAEYNEKWVNSDDMWTNRVALLFQLKYKSKVNIEILESNIEKFKDEDEFFIKKAIGWALREYSKYNPDYVKDYVENNELKNLSKKEALKWLNS